MSSNGGNRLVAGGTNAAHSKGVDSSQAGGSRHRVLPLAPGRLRPALLRSAMRGPGPIGCSRPHTHRAAACVAARLAVQATDQAARPCNARWCGGGGRQGVGCAYSSGDEALNKPQCLTSMTRHWWPGTPRVWCRRL